MYREKQLSQLAFFEELQKKCTVNDIDKAIELGINILRLAKEIDKSDEETKKISVIKIKKNAFKEALEK